LGKNPVGQKKPGKAAGWQKVDPATGNELRVAKALNPHYTYLLILAASLAGPLCLSFDRKVAFYKNWKYLFPALVFPGLLYIAWDIYFTYKGVWNFNDHYIIGQKMVNLPLEEVLFFFLIPYCFVFVYECVRSYFPGIRGSQPAKAFLCSLAVILLVGAIAYHKKYYTSWACLLTGAFIVLIYLSGKMFRSFEGNSFLVAYGLILIPFLVVNSWLTSLPVVRYDDAEILDFRIIRIPVEDTLYGLLLFLMVICFYERRKTRVS
jgi:lycopene cyclase domain-containing protein